MDWHALISAFGAGGQLIVLALIIYLVWSRGRDERERRRFEQRMDERTQALMEWTVKRAMDSAIPDKKPTTKKGVQ
jgi:hypothetical protein